jgi:hypothetical protein
MEHKFAGKSVREILRGKKASIKAAPLPSGSPVWDAFETMSWEQIEAGAVANDPGFKTVRKLLADRRFDR